MSHFDKRRGVVTACVVLPVMSAARVSAQSANVPRVGLLWIKSSENAKNFEDTVAAMRGRGYVTGKNISFDDRFLVERYDDLSAAAEKLARENHAVVLTYGTTATMALAKVTSSVPIVMVFSSDPVRAGLAHSLARPGKNATGFVAEGELLGPKRLEMLKEAVPHLRRIALLYSPQSPGQTRTLELMRVAADKLKVHIEPIALRSAEDIAALSATLKRSRVDGVLVTGSSFLAANQASLLRELARARLPNVFQGESYVVGGGLMAYGPDYSGRIMKAAEYVERILKGEKAGDLPIQQEMTYELAVNLKTAKALGIKLPPTIMVRATKVIE